MENGSKGGNREDRQTEEERERDGGRWDPVSKNEMQFFSSSLASLLRAFALLEIILCLI